MSTSSERQAYEAGRDSAEATRPRPNPFEDGTPEARAYDEGMRDPEVWVPRTIHNRWIA